MAMQIETAVLLYDRDVIGLQERHTGHFAKTAK